VYSAPPCANTVIKYRDLSPSRVVLRGRWRGGKYPRLWRLNTTFSFAMELQLLDGKPGPVRLLPSPVECSRNMICASSVPLTCMAPKLGVRLWGEIREMSKCFKYTAAAVSSIRLLFFYVLFGFKESPSLIFCVCLLLCFVGYNSDIRRRSLSLYTYTHSLRPSHLHLKTTRGSRAQSWK